MISKMTKTKAVLLHLQQYGNITSWEAIKEYGATRLSAIIFVLRHKYDLNIVSEMVEFTDRYGTDTRYAKYVLIQDYRCMECGESFDDTRVTIKDEKGNARCPKCGSGDIVYE